MLATARKVRLPRVVLGSRSPVSGHHADLGPAPSKGSKPNCQAWTLGQSRIGLVGWPAAPGEPSIHRQADGSAGYPQVCSRREKSRNVWHLGCTPRARRGRGTGLGGSDARSAGGVVKPLPAAALAAVLALLLVTGCNDPGTVDPRATASSTTSAPSTATPSPSPSETKSETPQERDARLAGEAVVNLWKVVGELARDPEQDPGLLDTVARDQAKTQWRVVLDSYTAKGLVQRGSASVTGRPSENEGRQDVRSDRVCGRQQSGPG